MAEIKEIKGKVVVPYHWSYGVTITKFFQETKDNKKLYGARCTKCKGVLVPPVRLCGKCFAPTEEEWVELSDHGRLVSFTTVYLPFPGQPTEPPYTYGMIRLDRADTDFPHMIKEIDEDKIKVDMRLQAVWSEDRKGNLFDIKYFKPEE